MHRPRNSTFPQPPLDSATPISYVVRIFWQSMDLYGYLATFSLRFPIEPKMNISYVAAFQTKSHFASRKPATKFFLCENCQLQSCKVFIGLLSVRK